VTDVFESRSDYAEPLTASEVADELGCSRRTALNKLHDLEAQTDLTSKKVGGRSRVWWIPVHV
jgi:predicted ArsR family transcriptional regulator